MRSAKQSFTPSLAMVNLLCPSTNPGEFPKSVALSLIPVPEVVEPGENTEFCMKSSIFLVEFRMASINLSMVVIVSITKMQYVYTAMCVCNIGI